ncbi:MAG: hypothetical protein WC728_03105 [Elusimicrobiota bacterium]
MVFSSLVLISLIQPAWSSTDTVKESEQTLVMPADREAPSAKGSQETLIMPPEGELAPPSSKAPDSETLVMPADSESPAVEPFGETPRKAAAPPDPGEEALAIVESMRETLDLLTGTLREGAKLKSDAGPTLKEMDRELKSLVDPQGIAASVSGIAQSLSVLSSGIAEADAAEQRQAVATLRRLDKKLRTLFRTEPRTAAPEPQPAPEPEEGSADVGLASLRSAVLLYFRESDGLFPKDLAQLVENGKYLRSIPAIEVGGHSRTASVRLLNPVRDQEDLDSQVADTGGWLYVSDPVSPVAGTVLIDCTHPAPDGVQWYKH